MDVGYIKKIIVIITTAVVVSFVSMTNLHAQGGSIIYWLEQINTNTLSVVQNTLNIMNNLTDYLDTLSSSLMQADNSSTTSGTLLPNMQPFNIQLETDISNQTSLQQQLNTNLLGKDATPDTLPNANDLVYQTLLGKLYFNPDPRKKASKGKIDPAYNYILNASGIGLSHITPSGDWQGSDTDQKKYMDFYNTVTSIESYNGYVLSSQYADKNQFNTLQTNLINALNGPPPKPNTPPTPSPFYTQIASENLGIVLRQMLLFQSQIFLLLTQQIQLQRQQLATQSMNNTLLVLSNSMNESYLASKAQGVKPAAS